MSGPMVVERSRGILRVHGRDPVRMIHGLATADIQAVTAERAAYTAFLTVKGKMVADARVMRSPADPAELLIDTATPALAPLMDHLARFVPPLFARAEDVSDRWVVVGVYGPGAGSALQGVADPRDGHAALPGDAAQEAVVVLGADPAAFAVSTRLTGEEGWDIFVPAAERDDLVARLLEAGAAPGSPEALEALRVAAGTPRWGMELTAEVIPLEAGLLDRAISQSKGCYTGQEVIVRILHRGHVNRHLRRLEFSGGAPEPGTELFEPGSDRPRGVVTSAVENEAGALGLGYVRREIEPPTELRAGSPDGPPVGVEELD